MCINVREAENWGEGVQNTLSPFGYNMKSKEELSKIASQNASKLWISISEEDRANLLNATLLSPTIRGKSKEARIAGVKKAWANKSPEERAI